MRGHDKVQAMRVHGKKPKIVFINDWPCRTDWFETGEHATVCVHNDDISCLDFNFLRDLTVSISSESESRVKRLFERAKAAGASVVAGCHVKKILADQTGWTEIYRKPEEQT